MEPTKTIVMSIAAVMAFIFVPAGFGVSIFSGPIWQQAHACYRCWDIHVGQSFMTKMWDPADHIWVDQTCVLTTHVLPKYGFSCTELHADTTTVAATTK